MFSQDKDKENNTFRTMLSRLIDTQIFNAEVNQYKIKALSNQRGIDLVKKLGINVLIKYESTTLAALCSVSGKLAEQKFGDEIISLNNDQLHFLCTDLGLEFTLRAGIKVLLTFTSKDIKELKISRIDWQKIKIINAETLSHDLLFAIGHYFTQKLNLSRSDKVELGIHFLKLIQRQSTEFPRSVMKSLSIVNDPAALMFNKQPQEGFEMARTIVGTMLHESEHYGFHQLRVLLSIAESFKPTPIKNVDNFVFKALYAGKFVEMANFVLNRLLDVDNQLKQKIQTRYV